MDNEIINLEKLSDSRVKYTTKTNGILSYHYLEKINDYWEHSSQQIGEVRWFNEILDENSREVLTRFELI